MFVGEAMYGLQPSLAAIPNISVWDRAVYPTFLGFGDTRVTIQCKCFTTPTLQAKVASLWVWVTQLSTQKKSIICYQTEVAACTGSIGAGTKCPDGCP